MVWPYSLPKQQPAPLTAQEVFFFPEAWLITSPLKEKETDMSFI